MNKNTKLNLRNGEAVKVYVCEDDYPRIVLRYVNKDGKEYHIGSLVTDERFGDPDEFRITTYTDPDSSQPTFRTRISRNAMREMVL